MPKLIEKPNLPKEIFAQEASPQLLSQAVRVHLANQRQGTQSALTRSEVSRTRRKYQKQKGSGNARHGDRKAPIFVGGGIAFAPKPRDYSLKLPDEMKRKALYGAFSSKLKTKSLEVVSNLDKLSGKTAEMAKFLADLPQPAAHLLIITDTRRENVFRAGRNIPGVTIVPANLVNTYEILKADRVLLMEEAIDKIVPAKPIKTEKPEAKKLLSKKVSLARVASTKTAKPVSRKTAKTVSKRVKKIAK